MKFIFALTLLLITLACRSQSNNDKNNISKCNRKVYAKQFATKLPLGICIIEGYQVMMIENSIDLTNDDVPELIMKLEKEFALDGDTSLLQIFKQDKKGIFRLYKALYNVYPLYFKSYNLDYIVKDSTLNELKGSYSSAEYSEVLLQKNTLIIKFHSEATMGYNFHFVYNEQKQDWFLQKIEEWRGKRGQVEQIESIITPEDNSKIGDFNYLDYL